MFIIYKITNLINQKVYIGKTCRSIEIRWKEHRSRAKNGSSFYLHNAIQKYGENNFKIEAIDYADNENKINELEQYWIDFYSSNKKDNGYNLTNGGEGIKKYDWEEFRTLWDKGYSIKEISQIYQCERHTVSDALKEYPNYSYKESLKRSSASKKAIDKYDFNKNLLKTYSSILEAAKDVGGSEATISKCIKNHTYSALGYFWNYHGEKLPEDTKIVKTNKKRRIKQYDKDNNYIKSFPSAAAAAREIDPLGNINSISSCIIQVCNGNRKSAYGYIWKREEQNNG